MQVQNKGEVRLANLREGDDVLVEKAVGKVSYERVLSFIHATQPGNHRFLTAHHGYGLLRASANHIVFVATGDKCGRAEKTMAELQVGDRLLVQSEFGSGVKMVESEIFNIDADVTKLGMFAPMTLSGKLIVDGALASQYASPASGMHLRHSVAHVVIFPIRALHRFGGASFFASIWRCVDGAFALNGEMHPFVDVVFKQSNKIHLTQLLRTRPVS